MITTKFITKHELFRLGIKLLIVDIAQFSRDLATDRRQYATALIIQLLEESESAVGNDREKWDLIAAVVKWRDLLTMSADQALEAANHYSQGDDGPQRRIGMMDSGWRQYIQLFEQQQAILQKSNLVKIFGQALALMPGITNLSFQSSWNIRPSILENGGRNGLRRCCLELAIDDHMPPPQLTDFFEAWYKSGRPLRAFECSSSVMFLPAALKTLTPSSMSIFKYTRRVTIDYGSTLIETIPTCRDIEANAIQSGFLSTMLSAASMVEYIRLSGAINVFFADVPVTLDSALGKTYWANLESLYLSTIEIELEELEALCERQRGTLTSLEIQKSGLFGGTWAGALPIVRMLGKLRHVELNFLWHEKEVTKFIVDDDSAHAVRGYVLDGGTNPLESPLSLPL